MSRLLFFLQTRNCYTFDFIESFNVNLTDLVSSFIQPKPYLIVCIILSTNPIAR